MEETTRKTNQLIGHNIQRKYLSLLYKKGRLPKAILFVGRESIGKKRVAKWWIETMLCEKDGACGRCRSCLLLKGGVHPDLFWVEKEGDEILIDDIRSVHSFVVKSPYYTKRKVVLIDNVENINVTAANAFLKILEEPPEHTIFILISSNLYKIIPTIRSRCVIVRFSPINIKSALTLGVLEEDKVYEGAFAPIVDEKKSELKRLFKDFVSPYSKKAIVLKDRKKVFSKYRIIGLWLHDILVYLLNKADLRYNVILEGGYKNLDRWIETAEYFFEKAELLDFVNLGIVENRISAGIRMIER